MPNSMDILKSEWPQTLEHIKRNRLTPVIGDGVHELDQATIAKKMLQGYLYPFNDQTNLARVMQFIAVSKQDRLSHTYDFTELIEEIQPAAPKASGDIHNTLAELPLPLYITTNHDDNMYEALKKRGKKPRRSLYVWKEKIYDRLDELDVGFTPDSSNPLVYHLYGHKSIYESLVLTEDDLLDYLASMSGEVKITDKVNRGLHPFVQRALARNVLLFLGYRMDTLFFRVLLRSFFHAVESPSLFNLAIQLPPSPKNEQYFNYLKGYFEEFSEIKARIYWYTIEDFAKALEANWKEYRYG